MRDEEGNNTDTPHSILCFLLFTAVQNVLLLDKEVKGPIRYNFMATL